MQVFIRAWIGVLAIGVQAHAEETNRTVTVAAIQCPSVMGETAANLKRVAKLARKASIWDARIMVFPECAVQGYMDAVEMLPWRSEPGELPQVADVAETIPGPSTRMLSALAKEVDAYLCIGIIEVSSNRYYNAQVLLSPTGALVGHHRKRAMWTPGDSTWASKGDRPVQVIETEYGRLGMMICYDVHVMPALLAAKKADLVLYSVGWFGPNEKRWFGEQFPRKAVIPYGFDVVVSNWSSQEPQQAWPGRGHSCVIRGDGKVLEMAQKVHGTEIVIAELEY